MRSLFHARRSLKPRYFSTETAKSTPSVVASSVKPAPVPKQASTIPAKVKRGSSIGQRISSFAVGALVGGGFGYYYMQMDIQQSTQEIQDAIAALKIDCSENQEQLARRVAKLERQSAQIQNS